MKENKVAELLTKLRKEHGYTQSELADKLDVTFQAVSKWERGENLPDAYTLTDLARIYGITVDEILNGKVKPVDDEDKSVLKKQLLLILGIILIIISPVNVFIMGVDNWRFYVPMMIITVAIGVGLIVFATMGKGNPNQVEDNKSPAQKRREEIIYAFAAGIFMILGFVFDLFHIAWIVFIFAYGLTLLVDKDEEKDA